LDRTHWDRAYVDGRLWDREAGLLVLPGVEAFIKSRLPPDYLCRSRVDEENRVRFSIRANPLDVPESTVPLMVIVEEITISIPKMFPGLFIEVHFEAAQPQAQETEP